MTARYALLLDSGALHLMAWKRRNEAMASLKRWQDARRDALSEGSIVVPRRVVALVKIQPRKNKGAVVLGVAGGKARAAKLTSARRKEIARKAANARWSA